MVRRLRIGHPAQRLSQRAVRICCLPATHQVELLAQTVENGQLAPKNFDRLSDLTVSDRDVEITTQYKICTVFQRRHTIKNLLHRSNVSVFANRAMNTEHLDRTLGPRAVSDFPTNNP